MRTALYNPVGWIRGNEDKRLKDKLSYVGWNTGNLVYVDALKHQLTNPLDTWFGLEGDLNKIKSGVIPSSNSISIMDTALEDQSKAIEKVPFPVTLVGLGAQSTSDLNTPKKLVNALPESRRNALRKIADQAVSIGVRGAFTAECLEKLNIHNFRIIGCPSLYFCESGFENIINKEIKGINTVFNVTSEAALQYLILELGIKYNLHWIMQTMGEFALTLFNNTKLVQGNIIRSFPGMQIDINTLQNFIHTNANMFFSMDDWYGYLKDNKYDFAFGSRFHGNVAAFRCGIPALWVTHDTRTKELVKLFHLPHINISEMKNINNIEQLIEKCDYNEFSKYYGEVRKEYISFLEENDLDNNIQKNEVI
ncbi:hypothetical protein C0033_08575 [Clostridium sp. chh4-2]|uniref:polysaccharide pyruvyl transferase family protein n=1 Tax=Clostridium sp. chh4-2 TaxID=2067550 RepID=UPI000CCF888C|nr:polysaccharide pyruvyl transferase family protein [Clostridium sp. chh4-2]PNV62602.1 hypothetical protein C0033_08575 [Clostridium sp. chh4-2]